MLNDGKYQKGVNRILSISEMSTNYKIAIFVSNIDTSFSIYGNSILDRHSRLSDRGYCRPSYLFKFSIITWILASVNGLFVVNGVVSLLNVFIFNGLCCSKVCKSATACVRD